MKIDDLIYELIMDRGHAVIPGFGIFTLEKRESYIHPVENSFSPASGRLTFQLDKNSSGFELIKLMHKRLGLPEKEAEAQLKALIKKWVKMLRDKQEVVFENTGTIRLNASGVVIFTADEKAVFDKRFFGLESFSAQPVDQTIPAVKTAVAASGREEEEKKVSIWWAAAAFVIIALAVGATWYFASHKQDGREAVQSAAPAVQSAAAPLADSSDNRDVATTENTQSQDSTAVAGQAGTEEAMQQTAVAADDKPPVEEARAEDNATAGQSNDSTAEHQASAAPPAQNPANRYFLIAGCFQDPDKAAAYVEELRRRGYPAGIEGKTSGGLLRVCYAGYPTWAEAKKAHAHPQNRRLRV